jgi:putative hydrolase of HD superfamily
MNSARPARFDALARFGYELGHLKQLPRSGWLRAGIRDPENVAAHSFRVAVLALLIAHEEGADPEHAAVLGLFHDLPEVRSGDIGSVGKRYAFAADPTKIAADQVADLPPGLAQHITDLVREHESAKTPSATPESLCSRDADKLDCLLQAREYQQAGNAAVQPWIEDMVAAITTTTGQELAREAREMTPSEWWERLSLAEQLPRAV